MDAQAELLKRLEELIKRGEEPETLTFNKEEIKALQEWARFMMAWNTLGRWGASLRQVIIFFGGALAFLAALRLGLLDWLGITGGER